MRCAVNICLVRLILRLIRLGNAFLTHCALQFEIDTAATDMHFTATLFFANLICMCSGVLAEMHARWSGFLHIMLYLLINSGVAFSGNALQNATVAMCHDILELHFQKMTLPRRSIYDHLKARVSFSENATPKCHGTWPQ